MKKTVIFSLVAVFLLGTTSGFAKTIKIVPDDRMLIQKFINDAAEGDTLLFAEGRYVLENPISVFQKKRLKFKGAGRAEIIGEGRHNAQPMITLSKCESIVFDNLIIKRTGIERAGETPILKISESKTVALLNMVIKFGYHGVVFDKAVNFRIAKSFIEENVQFGIQVISGSGKIEDSKIRKNKKGIEPEKPKNVTIDAITDIINL